MYEKIKNFAKNNSLGIIIFISSFMIAYVFSNSIKGCGSKEVINPVSDPKYKLNLESDMGRLECVFEQRRCLFENIGFDKEGILSRCGEIDYCDKRYKK